MSVSYSCVLHQLSSTTEEEREKQVISNATFISNQQTLVNTVSVYSLLHSVLLAKSTAAVFHRERNKS